MVEGLSLVKFYETHIKDAGYAFRTGGDPQVQKVIWKTKRRFKFDTEPRTGDRAAIDPRELYLADQVAVFTRGILVNNPNVASILPEGVVKQCLYLRILSLTICRILTCNILVKRTCNLSLSLKRSFGFTLSLQTSPTSIVVFIVVFWMLYMWSWMCLESIWRPFNSTLFNEPKNHFFKKWFLSSLRGSFPYIRQKTPSTKY